MSSSPRPSQSEKVGQDPTSSTEVDGGDEGLEEKAVTVQRDGEICGREKEGLPTKPAGVTLNNKYLSTLECSQ